MLLAEFPFIVRLNGILVQSSPRTALTASQLCMLPGVEQTTPGPTVMEQLWRWLSWGQRSWTVWECATSCCYVEGNGVGMRNLF